LPQLERQQLAVDQELGKALAERWTVLFVETIDGPNRVLAEYPCVAVIAQIHSNQADRLVGIAQRQGAELIQPRRAIDAGLAAEIQIQLAVDHVSQSTSEPSTFRRLRRFRQMIEPQVMGG